MSNNQPTRKLVCHLGKMKAGQLTGVQLHHQREKTSRTNPDIDYSRSHLNYDLHNDKKIKFLREAKRKIEENAPKARIRKDSNFVIEAELSAGRKFWETASPAEQKRFFEEAYNFMAEKIGKKNVVYAIVHNDEASPHMHFGFTPVTRDGRLNSRDVIMHRDKMARVHVEFYQWMKQRGFQIEQGEPAKEKHLEPQRWKVQQLEKKEQEIKQRAVKVKQFLDKGIPAVKGLVAKKQQLEQELKPLVGLQEKARDVYSMEADSVFLDKERVKVKKEDWEGLKRQALYTARLQGDADRLNRENQMLHGHIQKMGNQFQEMRKELTELREVAKDHKELEKYVEQLELKLDLIEQELDLEFELDFDDLELEDDEMSPRKKRGRRSGRAKLKARRRPKDRPFGRHQQQRRRQQQSRAKQPQQKRDHGKIVDRGRY